MKKDSITIFCVSILCLSMLVTGCSSDTASIGTKPGESVEPVAVNVEPIPATPTPEPTPEEPVEEVVEGCYRSELTNE
jgi:hypothetical protein